MCCKFMFDLVVETIIEIVKSSTVLCFVIANILNLACTNHYVFIICQSVLYITYPRSLFCSLANKVISQIQMDLKITLGV